MRYFRVVLAIVAMVLVGCNAQQNVLYLQDIESGTEITLPENYLIRIKPHDQITVVAH